MDAYIERRQADQRQALLVARSQAIWSRCDPKKIPSAKAIMAGTNSKPKASDLKSNAMAWMVVIRQMNKGRAANE